MQNLAGTSHIEHHFLFPHAIAPAHWWIPSDCCCVDRAADGPGRERRTWHAALLHVVHLIGCRVSSAHAVVCSGSFVDHWRLVGVRNGYHRAEKASVAPQHASARKFDPVGAVLAYADYHADFVPELRRWIPYTHVSAQWKWGEWPSVFVVTELGLRVDCCLSIAAFHG
jgi:hypothetical protein